MAYIFGRRAFYDREMAVSPAVLIPRPETELLLELALDSQQAARPTCVAADIGTGSGAIAVTFAARAPHATVYAVDISADALAVAAKNADANEVRVTFAQGDLLTPLIERGVTVDLLMANLPYIASDEVPRLDVSLFEPALALDGGPDGLDLIRRLLADAPRVLRPGALVLLEIGAEHGPAAAALAQAALPDARVEVFQDLAELDRIVRAEL
jgi:release factor glutamine methyltransferase